MGFILIEGRKAINTSAIITVSEVYNSSSGGIVEKGSMLTVISDRSPAKDVYNGKSEKHYPTEHHFRISLETMLKIINNINALHETIDLSTDEKVQEAKDRFSDDLLPKSKVHLKDFSTTFNHKP